MRIPLSIMVWTLYGAALAVAVPLTFTVWLVSLPFDRYRRLANRVFMFFGQSFVVFNPLWRIRYHGLQNYEPGKARIFIGNHQGFMDMPLIARLPWKMKWVSKKELFRVPAAGWLLTLAGHIGIERGTRSAVKALQGVLPYLKAGIPVMIFPEGTRSHDGELRPFRRGAFHLASQYGYEVQPIVVHGTNRIMRPGDWKVSPRGTMHISLLESIHPGDFDTVEAFTEHTHQRFRRELERLRALDGAEGGA